MMKSKRNKEEKGHTDSEFLRNSFKNKKIDFVLAKSNPCDTILPAKSAGNFSSCFAFTIVHCQLSIIHYLPEHFS